MIKLVLEIMKTEHNQDKSLIPLIVMAAVFEKCRVALSVFLPAYIIDFATKNTSSGNLLCNVIVLAFLIIVFEFAGSLLRKLISARSERADSMIRMDLNKHKMKKRYEYAVSHKGQESEERAIDGMSEFLEIDYLLFHEIFGAVFSLILMGYILRYVGIVGEVIIAVIAVLHYFLEKGKANAEHDFASKESKATYKLKYMKELLFNTEQLKDIKVNGGRGLVAGKYKGLLKDVVSVKKQKEKCKLKYDSFMTLAYYLQLALLYLVFIGRIVAEKATLGAAALIINGGKEVGESVADLLTAFAELKKVVLYYGDYKDFMQVPEINETGSSEYKTDDRSFCLEFKNVSFSYGKDEIKAVNNVSFSVSSGKTVSLVGDNGAGKTTIILLILRLLKPDSGQILLNGVDVEEIPYGKYVEFVAPVFQETMPFALSIKENIVLDRAVDPDRIKACISYSDFESVVEKCAKNEDTVLTKDLDEDGTELSGGEIQKLALARAKYHCGKLLLMDEPTASIDPLSEYNIYNNIHMKKEETVLFVSHRLTSTLFSDNIIVMSHGEIVQQGTHDELIKEKGLYAEMFEKQSYFYRNGEA